MIRNKALHIVIGILLASLLLPALGLLASGSASWESHPAFQGENPPQVLAHTLNAVAPLLLAFVYCFAILTVHRRGGSASRPLSHRHKWLLELLLTLRQHHSKYV